MFGRSSSTIGAVAIALTLASGALAQGAPGQMAFQGRLVRADGTPESGSHTLVFSLYSAPTGGAALWQETVTPVPVTNGYYALILGGSAPLPTDAFNGQRLYLGVAISGQSEFSPRINLVSVPYAIQSANADKLEGQPASNFANATHSHGTATTSSNGFMSSGDKSKVDSAVTSAGSGLTKSGSSLAVSFSGSGSASTAARSDHGHGLSCSYRTNSSGSTSVTSWCAAGEILTGGGCGGPGIDDYVPTGVTTSDGSVESGGPGYSCQGTGVTAHAICCRIGN